MATNPFVRIHGRKLVLNKELAISRMVTGQDYKEIWGGELTRFECEALIYFGNWERIYTEFLVYIMAILSDTDFVVF